MSEQKPQQAHELDGDDGLLADLREAFGMEFDASDSKEHSRLWPDVGELSMKGSSGGSGRLGLENYQVGKRLGDFEVIGELGRGGMGTVFRARQLSLGREVALKVLPDYAHRGRLAIQRFRTEAKAAARLHHTNVVPVYAQGEYQGQFYYAMELIEGGSLDFALKTRTRILCPSDTSLVETATAVATSIKQRTENKLETDRANEQSEVTTNSSFESTLTLETSKLRRVSSDYRHLARMIAEVADGLEHAHESGVVHRDIKPQNLLVGKDNRLHITDFGLARLAEGPGITMSGEVMGTPAYLSPEQVRADQRVVDHRTDIYSLGVTLYELLALRRPFEGDTREQLLDCVRSVDPVPLRRLDQGIPKDLQTICLKAMDKEPAARYQTAAAMAEDLRRFADGRPILSRPAGPVVRAYKWARRHKALSAAIVSFAIACALGAGLYWSVSSARRQEAAHLAQARQAEADQLLQEAYDHIVFFDYRINREIYEKVLKAKMLGADPTTIRLLKGILHFSNADRPAAIKALKGALTKEPANTEALYMLACVYDRIHQVAEADQCLAQANAIDEMTPGAWFFRGLAYHYRDPDKALESYSRARQMRIAEGKEFLQATLQLARIHNQRMYATRSMDDFAAAVDASKRLVEFEVYEYYPYYILSTTHRLAAEIYAGSRGTRSDSIVAQHYDEALSAARQGQEVAPQNASAYSAEALCLESMDRFEDAIAVYGKIIESGNHPMRSCEAHHYRWRLEFWMGKYQEALKDIDAHTKCVESDDKFYHHVYPAIIYAEMGDMQRAVQEAYAITDDNPSDPIAVIWTATCLNLFGQPDEAKEHLDDCVVNGVDNIGTEPWQTEEWVDNLWQLVLWR